MVQSGGFETEKAAERWLERELYPPNSYRYLLEERGVKPGAFRRRGQRGPKPAPNVRLQLVLTANGAPVPPPEGPKPGEDRLSRLLDVAGGKVIPLSRGWVAEHGGFETEAAAKEWIARLMERVPTEGVVC